MNEDKLDVFDPNREALLAMVRNTEVIREVDLSDKTQLETVRTARIELKNARVTIQKIGKAAREESQAYTKKVIEKEKELIAIIEPEEDRLAAIETKAEEMAIRHERMEKLPARRERLATIGDTIEIDDEYLLTLDALAFEAHFNSRVASKNAADRATAEREQRERDEAIRAENAKKEAELAEERRKLDEARLENEREAHRLQAEKEAREREEAAREEGRLRAEREAQEAESRRVANEEAEKEAQAQEEAKLAKREEYRKWRAECGWTEETKGDWKEEKTEVEVILWHKEGAFTL